MALDIKSGIQSRPQKVVIYGAEGIGKTTLASHFPDPLFLDLEGGTSQLDVKRLDNIKNWMELKEVINEIYKDPSICRTVVVDTADALEQMAIRQVCEEKNIKGIEDIGYGKGYTYLTEKMAEIMSAFDILIRRGFNVVLIAHAQMRKFEQPDELGAYDRWELKLLKRNAPMVKEWADMVLFCNYKTDVSLTADGKAKARGGKRVIYAAHHPCWDAKNRHGLPDMFDMDYEKLKAIFEEDKDNAKA